jgi:DNA invertase Pin-like site-specific DNA recombinase
MKTLIYARVSTSHHDQRPELQINELRKWCEARGWQITIEIIDHGFSGATDNRPGLKRLLTAVREKEVDAVVVLKLDRLFRSLKHLVTTLEEFEKLKIQFVAVKDNVDYSTPSGRFFVQILGSLGEFERSLLRERTIMGLDHARSLGKVLGRPRLHDQEKIFSLHQEGKSYRDIQKITGAPLASISKAIKAVHQTSHLSKSKDDKDPVHHSFVKRTAKSSPESEDSVNESDDTDLTVKSRTLDKV